MSVSYRPCGIDMVFYLFYGSHAQRHYAVHHHIKHEIIAMPYDCTLFFKSRVFYTPFPSSSRKRKRERVETQLKKNNGVNNRSLSLSILNKIQKQKGKERTKNAAVYMQQWTRNLSSYKMCVCVKSLYKT